MTADITFDTTHHAQVEAFHDMQRQRDRIEDERDAAILRADQAEQQREQVRDIAALLESEVETQRRWINDARVLAEGLPCSKPPLECRRCLILRALRGES